MTEKCSLCDKESSEYNPVYDPKKDDHVNVCNDCCDRNKLWGYRKFVVFDAGVQKIQEFLDSPKSSFVKGAHSITDYILNALCFTFPVELDDIKDSKSLYAHTEGGKTVGNQDRKIEVKVDGKDYDLNVIPYYKEGGRLFLELKVEGIPKGELFYKLTKLDETREFLLSFARAILVVNWDIKRLVREELKLWSPTKCVCKDVPLEARYDPGGTFIRCPCGIDTGQAVMSESTSHDHCVECGGIRLPETPIHDEIKKKMEEKKKEESKLVTDV